MRILGIDPGLQVCGYAVIDVTNGAENLIEAGTFCTNGKETLEKRLTQIAADVQSVLETFVPDMMAVEDLYSHYAHPKTAILMGHARGVILQQACGRGIKVLSFAATKIKKSVTGNGRASKAQVQRTVKTLLGLASIPEPADVADAIAVALCCANSQEMEYNEV